MSRNVVSVTMTEMTGHDAEMGGHPPLDAEHQLAQPLCIGADGLSLREDLARLSRRVEDAFALGQRVRRSLSDLAPA